MALQPNTYHNTNIRYIFQFAKFPTSQSLRIAQPYTRLYRHIGHIVPRHTLINYDAPRYCGFWSPISGLRLRYELQMSVSCLMLRLSFRYLSPTR